MSTLARLALAILLVGVVVSPGAAQSGAFGNAVLVEGDAMIVGEPNNSFRPGTVYLYEKRGGSWTESGRLTAPNAERADGFGALLATTGSTLFVASRDGRIDIFEGAGTAWSHRSELDTGGFVTLDPRCDYNGYCGVDFGLTMAAGGDWLLVGESAVQTEQSRLRQRRRSDEAADSTPAGVVHVYRRGADGSWSEAQRLEAPVSANGDAFGAAIAIEGDRALVGAPLADGAEGVEAAGRVFEFRLRDGMWQPFGELAAAPEAQAAFGSAIALDGDRAVVGAPNAGLGVGTAWLFRAQGEGWGSPSRIDAPEPLEGDIFGDAVAFAGDDLWIGAPVTRGIETGMAFVLSEGDARTFRFTEEQTNTEDSFGHRVVSDGEVVAVTASGLDHQAGGVFVYERDGSGAWQQVDLLLSPPDAMASVTGEERRCTEGSVEQFDCTDIELYAYIPGSMLTAPERARGVRANDNWGWTDAETGREYALVGRNDGTSFIDITDPTQPRLIGDLPKTPNTPRSQLWRDIKTYKDHAFIVADGAGAHGMQVFDLTRLRDVRDAPVVFEPDLLYRGEGSNVVESTHNVIINEETGFAYLTSRGCAGMHMIDITEPLSPTFVGCSEPGGTHDAQCVVYRGPHDEYHEREICLRMSGSRFQISDVTDKDNPVELSNATHPNPAYMHQGWLTDDHRYFIMNDESDVIAGNVETTRTLVWDLEDLEDPVLAREFFGSLPASAHNLYVKGDFTYQANYKYGLHILDTSDPMNPVEVGMFDTAPYGSGAGFGGAWSTYPFFDSGAILVTSMQEGLFVVKKRTRPIS
ncbi:choice-of-anchor B family protein [Gemmatimonadota bacterium Y43]|uniref:choice-of-anchor B family protein n=1 Tax=Gaopeijia maritima TaxID=3119007 RepID=UPI0032764F64